MAGTSGAAAVRELFRAQYPDSPSPRLFRAPGRVNLIGEHTDYNLGFVLPIAIDLACFVAAAPNGAGVIRLYSDETNERHEFAVQGLAEAKPSKKWTDYPIGVAQQLVRRGFPVEGMNLAIHSTVPVGSGLSSSAAIEVSTALALLHGREIGGADLARLCQAAEREFVGMPCGIMDQYVSVHGAPHKAVMIDCRSITHKLVSLPENVAVIAVNTMVKHELSGSAYRDRVRECAEAVTVIQGKKPEVQSLRDVRSEDLLQFRNSMPDVPFRRARHVTTEDERVQQFDAAGDAGDLELMGKLFIASHRSLQHDYEVSCEELDYLVDTAITMRGVYGSRMTGGGFGGCTVNLVKPEVADTFASGIAREYKAKYNLDPQIYRTAPAAGASEIE